MIERQTHSILKTKRDMNGQEFLTLLISADSVSVVEVHDISKDKYIVKGSISIQFVKHGLPIGEKYILEGTFDYFNLKVIFNQFFNASEIKNNVGFVSSFSIYDKILGLFNDKIKKNLASAFDEFFKETDTINQQKTEVELGKELFIKVREWVGSANSLKDFISSAIANDYQIHIWNEEETFIPRGDSKECVTLYEVNVIGDCIIINVEIYEHHGMQEGDISINNRFELLSNTMDDWDGEIYNME